MYEKEKGPAIGKPLRATALTHEHALLHCHWQYSRTLITKSGVMSAPKVKSPQGGLALALDLVRHRGYKCLQPKVVVGPMTLYVELYSLESTSITLGIPLEF